MSGRTESCGTHLVSFCWLLVLDIQGCRDADLGWNVQQRLDSAEGYQSARPQLGMLSSSQTHVAPQTLIQNGGQQPSMDDSIVPAQTTPDVNDDDGGLFIVLDKCKRRQCKH